MRGSLTGGQRWFPGCSRCSALLCCPWGPPHCVSVGSSHGLLLEQLWLWIWSATASAVSAMGPAREALQLGALAARTGPPRCSLIPQRTGLAILCAPAWGGSCSTSVRASSFLSSGTEAFRQNFLIPPDQFHILLCCNFVALLRTFHLPVGDKVSPSLVQPFSWKLQGLHFFRAWGSGVLTVPTTLPVC